MVVECRLLHVLEIGLHTQFVGEIMDVKVEETAFDADGQPAIEKIRPILFSPRTRKYHGVGEFFLGKAFEVGRDLMKKLIATAGSPAAAASCAFRSVDRRRAGE